LFDELDYSEHDDDFVELVNSDLDNISHNEIEHLFSKHLINILNYHSITVEEDEYINLIKLWNITNAIIELPNMLVDEATKLVSAFEISEDAMEMVFKMLLADKLNGYVNIGEIHRWLTIESKFINDVIKYANGVIDEEKSEIDIPTEEEISLETEIIKCVNLFFTKKNIVNELKTQLNVVYDYNSDFEDLMKQIGIDKILELNNLSMNIFYLMLTTNARFDMETAVATIVTPMLSDKDFYTIDEVNEELDELIKKYKEVCEHGINKFAGLY
jgi:hypothetical protein